MRGLSAKQLERELGVTYKTAWRMFNLIRNQLMADEATDQLAGEVEADETFVGGKPRAYPKLPKNAHWDRKAVVFAMVERKGRVRAIVVPDSRRASLHENIATHVLPASTIYTDEWGPYRGLNRRYTHRRISHTQKIYVDGDVHTQTIEGFFGLVKNGLRGVYHSVSAKWLQGYLNEYTWRYNRRDTGRSMFHDLIEQAVEKAA